MVALKFPGFPSSFSSFARVRISTLRFRAHSTSFGETMQVAQSPVGKVLSRWAIIPPMAAEFSTR